jgi:hypothetical protein
VLKKATSQALLIPSIKKIALNISSQIGRAEKEF